MNFRKSYFFSAHSQNPTAAVLIYSKVHKPGEVFLLKSYPNSYLQAHTRHWISMLQTRIIFTYENYLLQPVLSSALLEKERKAKSLKYMKYVALYYPQVLLSKFGI